MSLPKWIIYGICYAVVCLLLLTSFLFWKKIPYRYGPGMCLNFDETNALNEEIDLLVVMNENLLMHIPLNEGNSGDNQFIYHAFSEDESVLTLSDTVSLSDDRGGRFYVCTAKILYEFDLKGVIQRKFHIDEFNLGSEAYYFEEYSDVANDSIWFRVSSSDDIIYAIEWNPNEPPANRIFHTISHKVEFGKPDMFGNVTLDFFDTKGNMIEGGFYFLDSKEIVNNSWVNFYHEEFESNSLICSHNWHSDKDDEIYFLENNYQRKKRITWGSMAQWGADGNLYFTRGSSQLWRWNPNNEKAERVFCASYLPIPFNLCGPCQLVFDKSRRYFAFLYSTFVRDKGDGSWPLYHFGVVVFDCLSRKYMTFDPPYFTDRYSGLKEENKVNENFYAPFMVITSIELLF